MNLAEKLSEILYCNNPVIEDCSYGKKIQFNINVDGDAPSLKTLIALSKVFGTEEIDMDYYLNCEGCDSCGYGRDEGHTLQIYNPTKNIEEARKLATRSN